MAIEDISVNVTLYCPVCGSDQFEYEKLFDEEYPDNHPFKCAVCGKDFTKAELIEQNADVIDANVEEMKEEIASQFAKEIEDAFKKAFR